MSVHATVQVPRQRTLQFATLVQATAESGPMSTAQLVALRQR
jgi:hypothetical protein